MLRSNNEKEKQNLDKIKNGVHQNNKESNKLSERLIINIPKTHLKSAFRTLNKQLSSKDLKLKDAKKTIPEISDKKITQKIITAKLEGFIKTEARQNETITNQANFSNLHKNDNLIVNESNYRKASMQFETSKNNLFEKNKNGVTDLKKQSSYLPTPFKPNSKDFSPQKIKKTNYLKNFGNINEVQKITKIVTEKNTKIRKDSKSSLKFSQNSNSQIKNNTKIESIQKNLESIKFKSIKETENIPKKPSEDNFKDINSESFPSSKKQTLQNSVSFVINQSESGDKIQTSEDPKYNTYDSEQINQNETQLISEVHKIDKTQSYKILDLCENQSFNEDENPIILPNLSLSKQTSKNTQNSKSNTVLRTENSNLNFISQKNKSRKISIQISQIKTEEKNTKFQNKDFPNFETKFKIDAEILTGNFSKNQFEILNEKNSQKNTSEFGENLNHLSTNLSDQKLEKQKCPFPKLNPQINDYHISSTSFSETSNQNDPIISLEVPIKFPSPTKSNPEIPKNYTPKNELTPKNKTHKTTPQNTPFTQISTDSYPDHPNIKKSNINQKNQNRLSAFQIQELPSKNAATIKPEPVPFYETENNFYRKSSSNANPSNPLNQSSELEFINLEHETSSN